MAPIPTPLFRAVIQSYSTYCMNHGLFYSPNRYVIEWKLNCSVSLVTTPRTCMGGADPNAHTFLRLAMDRTA